MSVQWIILLPFDPVIVCDPPFQPYWGKQHTAAGSKFRDQHTAGSKQQFRSSNYHGMTFHPTDCHCHGIFLICCSSISPTVVVLASMRCILAFCCAGLRPIVWQMQFPAWLSKQCHLNVSSTYSPSPQGPARSPQPILRLRPSSSICFLCRSTVILLLSATIISLRPLYPSTPVGLFAVFSRTGAVGCRPCPVSEVPPR